MSGPLEPCPGAGRPVTYSPRVGVYHKHYLGELRGKDLACWCPLDQPCHADVLLDLANRDDH